MRILYIRNINQVAEADGEDMVQHGHIAKVYEPKLVGSGASFPIKLSKMPERMLDLRHIIGDLHPDKFDLVHIHWASYGILGVTSRIPFIIECHGSDVRYRLQNPFFRSILTLLFNKAAMVLCITPDILQSVQSIRSDALFMPGPVDIHRFSPSEENYKSSTRPWTILLFTRLDPIKGPEIATQGIANFARRHPEVHVQLLDWGPLREEYKKHYSTRFEFLPHVPPERVHYLLQSADVVVGQCLVGALGLAELQAMSCAKPVIASFCHEEAYPTLPPIYQAVTSQEVDEGLEYFYKHQDQGIELGLRARKWVIAHHSRQVRTDKLEKIYQSTLHRVAEENSFE
jgi:glycosyltransferase involved in cell wall biosynthesis